MNTRRQTKYIHEGKYIAEADVELLENDEGWSPYLSIEDAYKLDDIRDALRHGDIKKHLNLLVFLALLQLLSDYFSVNPCIHRMRPLRRILW